jgi:putative glycosyltransferase (TIGR04348 family)
MPRPSVLIVTPYGGQANNGNWRTAARWARFLRDRYRVIVQAQPQPQDLADADCLVALHARRSHAAIRAWRDRHPVRPVLLVLTGTDLYADLPGDSHACDSVALADRLIVLQDEGLHALPREHQGKASVVYQSAPALQPVGKPGTRFNCLFVGHLREEKDPLTAMHAWEEIAAGAPVHLTMIGEALDPALAAAARALQRRDARFRWAGPRPHGWTRQAIKRAHLLLVCSRMEGGANVVVEAVTSGTPVLASRVPGNVGMLGREYAGYFPVGNAAGLAQLVLRCRDDKQFYRGLATQCRARRPLFAPIRERALLLRLVREALHCAHSDRSRPARRDNAAVEPG